jgi:hypothetical protein
MRCSGVVRSAVLCLAAALLAGCSGAAKHARSSQQHRAPRQSGLEAAAIATFLPASHSDLQTGLSLKNFYGAVTARIISACLQSHGFNLRYPNVPETYNWSDANSLFPDLERIASQGILTPADLRGERDWEPNLPQGERSAFDKVFTDCRTTVGRAVRSGTGFWFALQRKWADVDAKDDADPKYLRLLQGFGKCVERRGYQGTTPTSFLLSVDRLIAQSRDAGKPLGDQEVISLRMGKVYAACYGPANAYRQKLRMRTRARFLDQYALQIRAAQRQLEMTVERLSRKMGVTYQTAQAGQ